MSPIEEWRPCPGYEGVYSVSSLGRVRRDLAGKGARAGHILKQKIRDYYRVELVASGIQRGHLVHRLLAAAFIGPCPPGLSVNHKDGNKLNNGIANLEYVTLADNTREQWAMGLARPPKWNGYLPPIRRGIDNKKTRLTEEDVRLIRAASATGKQLAKDFGVAESTISAIRRGRNWKWLRQ